MKKKTDRTMYTDRNALREYPYEGEFYRREDIIPDDGNLLAESDRPDTIILRTVCDIQKTDKQFSSGVISMGYTVYFPMPMTDDDTESIPDDLKPGVRFRATMFNMAVDGMVIGVYPTQMHGCQVYIKGSDI